MNQQVEHDSHIEAASVRQTPSIRETVKGSTAYTFGRAVLLHRYIIGMSAMCAAFGIWHTFYPAAANRGANMAWNATEGTAGFVARIARKVNP